MRVIALCAAFVAISLLGSCSRLPYLELLNNSGGVIEIVHATGRGDLRDEPQGMRQWRWPWRWVFAIRQSQVREVVRLEFEDVTRSENWVLEIQVADCTAWYVVPKVSWHDWRDLDFPPTAADPRVQLEPDLTMHLIPGSATAPVDSAIVAPYQPNEFPVAPTAQSCAA